MGFRGSRVRLRACLPYGPVCPSAASAKLRGRSCIEVPPGSRLRRTKFHRSANAMSLEGMGRIR
jgi:hypothetical protein